MTQPDPVQVIECNYEGVSGQCISINQCNTGSFMSGICSEGGDVVCCLNDSISPDPTPTKDVELSEFLRNLVYPLLKFEHGVNLKTGNSCDPYMDTEGYPVTGYGHLCEHSKVQSDEEAASGPCAQYMVDCTDEKMLELLNNDIDDVIKCMNDYENIKEAFYVANEFRRAVLVSMAFQMGCEDLSGFKKTLALMAQEKWEEASEEMLDSIWATQTPYRANRHSYIIRYGYCDIMDCFSYDWWY